MPKKIVISILISILLFTYSLLPIFTPLAHAQDTSWYNQSYEEWVELVADQDNPDEIFGERYTAAQVRWIIYSLVWLLTTTDEDLFSCLAEHDGNMAECVSEILDAAKGLNTSYRINEDDQEKSLLASSASRPISSVAYFKDVATRLRIIPEARAQGFGFAAASPVLGLWRMVRNTTYFLLILVIIVMSFMIMFRVKISPQAIITVQSALPKVIVALILITFSYAIAGLLIDLMYVAIGLLAAILSNSGLVGTTFMGNDFTDWSTMFTHLTERTTIGLMLSYFFMFMLALSSSLFSGGWLSAITTAVVTGFSGGLIWIVIALILAIVLLIALVKIMWLLVKTYVMILLQVVFGPILILLGTLGPGGFGAWVKKLVAQLAVYPVAGFMFFMSFVFLRGAYATWENTDIPIIGPIIDGVFSELLDLFMPFGVTQSFEEAVWSPPLTIGKSSIEIMWLFASLAILLMIPKIADIIKSMIEGRPFAYGTAIGEPFAMIWGAGPVKEVREQVGAVGAVRGAEQVLERYPKRARGYETVATLTERLRKRAGI